MGDPNDIEVEVLFDLLRQRHGDRLVPEEMQKVREGVELVVSTAHELRSFELDNSVGPTTTFTPYRKAG